MSAALTEVSRIPTELDRAHTTGVLTGLPSRVPSVAGDHDTAYAFRGGRVGSKSHSDYIMPDHVRQYALAVPAYVSAETIRVFPLAAELVDRICPWSSTLVFPDFLRPVGIPGDLESDPEGGYYSLGAVIYRTFRGMAYTLSRGHGADLIVLSARSGPVSLLSCVLHEAFHICWPHFSDGVRDMLFEVTSSVPAWPSEYLEDPEEAACRLFEHLASAWLHGLPVPVGAPGVEGLMAMVYNGEFALLVIAEGLAEPLPRSKTHKSRPVPVPDVTKPLSLATRCANMIIQYFTAP